MHPLVQSALDAANRGEKDNAMVFLKRVLASDPNNVEAWLMVAAIVDQPERKRQCLNRVLALDPTNQIARDELLEMDRTAPGGAPLFDHEPVAGVSEPAVRPPGKLAAFQPVPVSRPEDLAFSAPEDSEESASFEPVPIPVESTPVPPQPQPETAPEPAPQKRSEKKLVFQFPPVYRLLMYFFLIIFGCGGLLVATQALLPGLFFIVIAVFVGLIAIVFSPKVEITETAIRVSSLLGSSEARWDDIKSMKSGWMNQTLELHKGSGEIVKISTQVSGYPRILQIMRRKRPDLFDMAAGTGDNAGESRTL